MPREKIFISNMICKCCCRVLKQELESKGVEVHAINLGVADVSYNEKKISISEIEEVLIENGFGLIVDKEHKIVEQIKQTVIELIHYMNNMDSIVRKSDYMVEKLGMSYQVISKIFSKYEPITLEKYIILNKIERTKELIDQDEYTLSEISYMMDYSSVQYLSNQFKTVTGMSVSDYKKSDRSSKKALNELYEMKYH